MEVPQQDGISEHGSHQTWSVERGESSCEWRGRLGIGENLEVARMWGDEWAEHSSIQYPSTLYPPSETTGHPLKTLEAQHLGSETICCGPKTQCQLPL